MTRKFLLSSLAAVAALMLVSVSPANAARSGIRVGVADQSSTMFDNASYKALKLKLTRYFVPSDVMSDSAERAKADAFVRKARANGVSPLIHISTVDLREKRGPTVSTSKYKRDVKKIVAHFRQLGVKDFGAWNEVNHKTQETWNKIGNAVSYFKSMYSAVKGRCSSCNVVGLDILDQAGSDRYMRSFYSRLSSTWRKRLKIVGIHNYSDVNRSRSSGTKKIITTARKYNKKTRFWFTETGALASFGGSFPYSESRQASRIKNMFSYAKKYRSSGVDRIYSYNFFGAESSTACGSSCLFDAGLVGKDGNPRPVYTTFAAQLKNFSR